ncbi:MAG TPA: proton-conducting transporter membrane subunit, partial [Tepidisphaeraceae bacterium]|nr:proton-conducting transporter membrane subunit [Tepidisphaeraceae bacterium]
SGRAQAGRKFFLLFSLLGSIPLLIALVEIHHQSGSLDLLALPAFSHAKFSAGGARVGSGKLMFALLMLTFLTRLAVVPLHRWVIDAHAQLPAPFSMIVPLMQTILGGYGIFRIAYPLFPDAAKSLWLAIAILGIITLLYGAMCALAQTDLKRLIAYASISQTGLILLGAAVMTRAGMNGAIYTMIAHAITFAMLFFLAGVIGNRTHPHDLSRLGGLGSGAPGLFGFATLAFFTAMGLPPFCGFIGEFLVLMGTFQAARPDSVLTAGGYAHAGQLYALATLGCVGGIVAAGIMLKALHRTFFGPARAEHADIKDLTPREIAVMAPLAAAALILGILPSATIMPLIRTTVKNLHDVEKGPRLGPLGMQRDFGA